MCEMQDYLKKINPINELDKPNLKYGTKYNCFLKGNNVGVFTWTKDESVGDSFQRDSKKHIEVCIPYNWEYLN